MDLQSADVPARLFAGKSQVGLFEATVVEQSPNKRTTPVGGAFAVGYRVSFRLKAILPSRAMPHDVVMTGQKGEGEGAGSLGLQDWLPSTAGEMVTLAFDSDHMTRARDYEFLGGSAAAISAWRDCERYYECIRNGSLDPLLVAGAVVRPPKPLATFFRLIFNYDRSPYNHPSVIRTLGGYFADPGIPPLERRNVVAHYIGAPNAADTEALSALAAGLFQLIFDLADSGQAASAGVVFQRTYGYFRTPGGYRIPPPVAAQQRLDSIRQLMALPPAGVGAEVRESIATWLARDR